MSEVSFQCRQLSLVKSAVIAVDLTPVLAGGDNGGAKIFVLELIRSLARLAPQWRYVLLTQTSSHEELSCLDGPNVERKQVIDTASGSIAQSRRFRLWQGIAARLPHRLRYIAARAAMRSGLARKRSSGGRLMREIGADLLFCPFTATVYAEPGLPTVSTIHDLQYRSYPQFFSAEDAAHRDHTFVTACRKATLLVAVSDYTRLSVLRHGEIAQNRVRTIHHRIAGRLAEGMATNASILSRLGVERDGYFLYPANFWRHKNHEMLLTAFGVAATKGLPEDVRLVCTGSPGERQDFLRESARIMGLGERIVFPGYVAADELSVLLENSKGVIFPSLYEGFGLPVLEAMSAGVPVACSNGTALPEVAGDAAILFNPGAVQQIAESMVVLATDASARRRLSDAGRKRAMEFSDVDRMGAEYLSAFCEAMAGSRPASSLAGVYEDSWVGGELHFDIVAPGGRAELVLDVRVPDWIPFRSVRIQARDRNGRVRGRRWRLARGATSRLSMQVGDGGLDVRLGPCFVPAQLGQGADSRELCLIMEHCVVRRADSGGEILWGAAES